MRSRLSLWLFLSISVFILVSCGGGGGGSNPPPPNPTPTAPADFQLIVASSGVTTQEGGAPQFQTVQANPVNGFAGTISLALSGLPAGVTILPSGPLSIVVTTGSKATAFQLAAAPTSPTGPATVTVTGTSGTITHTVTFSLNVSQIAPFTIRISPSSVSLTPASNTSLTVSVTANPGTSPQLNLNFSAPPNNSQVSIGIARTALTPTNPVSVPVEASVLAQPLQNFPISVTASDNANNTSYLTFPLTVTVPASRNNPTRSTFFRTEQAPTGMVYDPFRKLLFVSVEILNEVVVLSTVDGHQVASISVGFPAGIDEAADGSAVYVASPILGGVTIIDPASLQVVGHSTVPQSVSGLKKPVTFFQVAALSNGKVLFFPTFDVADLTKPPFFLWDPQTDTFSLFGPSSLSTSVGLISRSSDHSKVLGYGGIMNTGFVYDVTANTFSSANAALGGFPAVRPDGSQYAAMQLQNNTAFVLAFYDSNFNPLASIPFSELSLLAGRGQPLYSLDGKFLYVIPDQGLGIGTFNPVATVIDTSTFAVLGVVPAFEFGAALPFSGQGITTFAQDETGIVFGAAFRGVGFLDMNSPTFLNEPLPGSFLVQPSLASLSSITQAQLNGVGFSQGAPLALFLGAPPASPQSLPATIISVQSDNFVNISLPRGSIAGPANATLTRSDGFFEVMPDGVSFGPTILSIDANAGSQSGGDAIQITGYGLSRPNTQVTIGGSAATITRQLFAISGQIFPTERIMLNTPSGAAGNADVTVSTPSGSTTVPGGFQYLSSVQVFPITGLLDAIAYDKLRQRLYATNQDHNRVEVFDLVSKTFLTPVGVGPSPTALFVSPDSSFLAVLNRGNGTVSVVDLVKMTVTATFSLLTTADKDPVNCGGVALNITPAGPHGALTNVQCTAMFFGGVFHLIDLTTGSLSCTGVPDCAVNGTDFVLPQGFGFAALASSSDGNKVFLANSSGGGSGAPVAILDLSANTVTTGSFGDFSDAAISADGTILAANFGIFKSVNLTGLMAFEPYADVGAQSFHDVFGEKLNPSGSLLFYPQDSGVTIFDTHTGRLVRHLLLPDPIPADSNALALDETGTKMFLTSKTGITIAQLFQSPLSLGTVTPASGPQGTAVVLRGSGFQNGATVTFGALQASVTFVDAMTLKATVPALSAGPVRITIKNPDGHQYSLDDAFTVQ